MTKTLSILLLLALLVLLASCRPQTVDRRPLNFKGYENNPILGPGEPGTFDDVGVMTPYVIRNNDQFYLFYSGLSNGRKGCIGVAISEDGFFYKKFGGNPIFSPGEKGFDSYGVGSPIILNVDSAWVMYYNGTDIALFTPSPFIGRATSKSLTGPWERSGTPILTRGSKSEWDGGYIMINSVLKLEDGRYMLYYTGGPDYLEINARHIGLAVSADGINWMKYNDPTTTEHPFIDSDPVLLNTNQRNNIDNIQPWGASVYKISGGFEMYYSIRDKNDVLNIEELGYALSQDGIHWEPYPGNPFYKLNDDPFSANHYDEAIFEFPSLVCHDSVWFIYYDYGIILINIGMATSRVPSTNPHVN